MNVLNDTNSQPKVDLSKVSLAKKSEPELVSIKHVQNDSKYYPFIRFDFDFTGLRNHNGVNRLLEANGDVLMKGDPFYSDMILRINSFKERKVRVLVITSQSIYILIEESNSQLKIKSSYNLKDIERVEAAIHNSLLVNVIFKNKLPYLTLEKTASSSSASRGLNFSCS